MSGIQGTQKQLLPNVTSVNLSLELNIPANHYWVEVMKVFLSFAKYICSATAGHGLAGVWTWEEAGEEVSSALSEGISLSRAQTL